jgi:hypothetical protein
MSDSTEYEKFAERFESAMSAWKFQVDSYWTRSSYFAVFETAAAAGVWQLIDAKHWWTSLFFSLGLVVLTGLWFFNNIRLHEYIVYWWKRAGLVEETYMRSMGQTIEANPKRLSSVKDYELNRVKKLECISYHWSIQLIPVLFFFCWVWTAGLSVFYLARNCHPLCQCLFK